MESGFENKGCCDRTECAWYDQCASWRAAGLTSQERRVAVLLAYRASNKEIAQRLRVIPRTAENHVAHTLDKLAVSRHQLMELVPHSLLASEPACIRHCS